MIKRTMVSIIFFVALMIFSIYVIIYRSDKYSGLESTDLSKESIGGVSLMDKYSSEDVEKKFGQLVNDYKKNNSIVYEYQLGQAMLLIEVDKNNNITEISYNFGSTSITTNKGMAKVSTLNDIKKAYGDAFLEEEHKDSMGGAFKEITYVDRDNHYKIPFLLYEHDDWDLGYASISLY